MEQPGPTDRPVKSIPAGRHFAFTPDSRFLLTGLGQSNQLWSTETWTSAASFEGLAFSGEANAPFAFGRLGRGGVIVFAIADETGIIRLFEMTRGSNSNAGPSLRLLGRLEGPDRKRIASLVFNPQGSRLAAATAVQTVQVWDLAGVRRGLEDLGLADSIPEFTGATNAPLTISFGMIETHDSLAAQWSRVCKFTFDLMDAVQANPADRAVHLVNRGRIYLDRLGRPDLARADFQEALRLKPGDAGIAKLLNRVRNRVGSPQSDMP